MLECTTHGNLATLVVILHCFIIPQLIIQEETANLCTNKYKYLGHLEENNPEGDLAFTQFLQYIQNRRKEEEHWCRRY